MRPHPTGLGITLGFLFAAVLVFFAVLVVLGVRTEQARSGSTTLDDPTTTSLTTSPPPTISPRSPVGPVGLEPAEVTVSSRLSEDYGADRLFDGDASTAWRDDSLHGEGAVITVAFDRSVTIFAVLIRGLEDEVEFHASYRIRRLRLDPGRNGLPQEVELPDTPETFRVDLGGVTAEKVTIEVISTYAAESYRGEPAREELAVAEIEILGEDQGR